MSGEVLAKILLPKTQNGCLAIFCEEILPIVSCPFREKLEAGVCNQGTFRKLFYVLLTSWVEIVLEATISIVFPTQMYV